MRRDYAAELLRYTALLLAIVAGLAILSLLVGDRVQIGRIAWLVVGILLAGLWGQRSRLPVLSASSGRVAGAGWLGLVLAGAMTLAIAPTSMPSSLPLASASVGQQDPGRGSMLKPAPPTAVRRSGTIGPVAEIGPAAPRASPAESPPASPAGGFGATSAPPSPSPSLLPVGFDPRSYLGQGNAYDCADFVSQAEAQAVLRADPTDPNVIDLDRDGIACESRPAPRDARRVPRPVP
jgi:hypothetical protein